MSGFLLGPLLELAFTIPMLQAGSLGLCIFNNWIHIQISIHFVRCAERLLVICLLCSTSEKFPICSAGRYSLRGVNLLYLDFN